MRVRYGPTLAPWAFCTHHVYRSSVPRTAGFVAGKVVSLDQLADDAKVDVRELAVPSFYVQLFFNGKEAHNKRDIFAVRV